MCVRASVAREGKSNHSHGTRSITLNLGRSRWRSTAPFCWPRDCAPILTVDFIYAGDQAQLLGFLQFLYPESHLVASGSRHLLARRSQGSTILPSVSGRQRTRPLLSETRSSRPEPQSISADLSRWSLRFQTPTRSYMVSSWPGHNPPISTHYSLMTHRLLRRRAALVHLRAPFCQPSYSYFVTLACGARFLSTNFCCRPTQLAIQSTFS